MSLIRASAVERAFEIARSGRAKSIQEIQKTLDREGYDYRKIYGKALCRQLHEVIQGEPIKPLAPKKRAHRRQFAFGAAAKPLKRTALS